MASALVSLFHKKVGCPSSQDLLEYDQAGPSSADSLSIEAHLASCDFCNAELQLLQHHRSNQEEYAFAEMPLSLLCLAERFLPGSVAHFHASQRLEENRRT
jgi:hypothetical protein